MPAMLNEYYVDWDHDNNFYTFWLAGPSILYPCKQVRLCSKQLTDYMNAYHQYLDSADPIFEAIDSLDNE